MPWPVHPNGLLGAQGDNDTYRIERSLRFNSADSANLTRTLSAPTNNTIWTWSSWIKRSKLSTAQAIFGAAQQSVQFVATDAISIYVAGNPVATSTALFRDVSAWYHVLVVSNGTTIAVNINNSSIISYTGTMTSINSAILHTIGRYANTSVDFFDGYLAEINFIDGQALTPSSFGETDPITGRWKAKAYSGTYGTNGFYLKFADNSGTTATTLGKDSSGNGNNWTPNNFSVTAGAGNDSLVDSPTNYGTDAGVGGGVRGNYATLNTLDKGGSINTPTNGNLDITSNTTGFGGIRGTVGVSSGKWYWEFESTSSFNELGICSSQTDLSTYIAASSSGYVYVSSSGNKANNGTYSSYGSTFTSGDTIGIAFNADSGSIEFFKNNVSQGVAFSSIPSGTYFPAHSDDWGSSAIGGSYNFGQRPFKYTAPSGFKALCTTNLPTPTIKKPSSYMDVVTYTGTGATQTISGLGFSPDLLWTKGRSLAQSNNIFDTQRSGQRLRSDTTGAESSTTVTLGSNGFTLGTETESNNSGSTFVAWAWDEAPIAGMDIVGYVGDGVAGKTVAHNLGVAPKMIIVKNRTTAGFDFVVYHQNMNATPQGGYVSLNATTAYTANTAIWNNTAPSSSVFTLGTNTAVNKSSDNHIAYLFSEVEGFSKFGSFAGNNSTDGPFIWCGFRPKYILVKKTSASGPWMVFDSSRDTFNVSTTELRPNEASAEPITARGSMDILSNGFKIRSTSATYLGELGDFVFAAFAESPFKYARAR